MSEITNYRCPLCFDPNPARDGNSTCKEIEPNGEIYKECLERQLTATQRRENKLRDFVTRITQYPDGDCMFCDGNSIAHRPDCERHRALTYTGFEEKETK